MTAKSEKKQASNWESMYVRITIKRIDNGLLLDINDVYYSSIPKVPNVSRAFSESDWDWITCTAERYIRSNIAAIKENMAEETSQ